MHQVSSDRAAGGAAGWLARVRGAHFHDYTRATFVLWVAIVAAGVAALCGALTVLGSSAPGDLLNVGVALVLVATAAWFPVEIPRSKYSVSASDAFVFTILAALGPAPAILASGVDGSIGAWRSSRRLTSRISTPAAAMAAMAVCAAVFRAASHGLIGIGVGAGTAQLASLALAALAPFVLTTWPLLALVTLKKGRWPDTREWFSNVSWFGGLLIAAALVAGLIQLAALADGPAALAIIGLATLGAVILVRVTITRNETEHRAQEARVAAAERDAELNLQRFAAAFADASIGMAIVGPDGRIVRANNALCSLLVVTEAALEGKALVDVLSPVETGPFERQAEAVRAHDGAGSHPIELRCKRDGAAELWIALHCGRFTDVSAGVEGLIYQLHDVTSRRLAEGRLQHMAFHDDLTGLWNRAGFQDQLAHLVEATRDAAGSPFALLFLDVDRFKVVNDSLGHGAGNELLRALSLRLARGVRGGDQVARLGGDEFAILLVDREPAAARADAERLLAALARPVALRGNELCATVSIGITFSDLGYRTVDELLRDADLAMYEAKSGGRDRVVAFDRGMHERTLNRLAIEQELRRAITEKQLSLVFQPLYNLQPYRLAGFEALARWVHPTRGPISPGVFIPIAEEAGLIDALTDWALEEALAQLAGWNRRAPELAHLGVNVNISGQDLLRSGFAETVMQALRRHRVAPRQLTLEITESVLMNQLDIARDALATLRAAGVGVAIDDFGTGYSSLAYLSKLPIDSLKIDRSFVAAIESGTQGVEIVRAIQALGTSFAKRIVAEGIETPRQLDALRQIGVSMGQGYFLGRPLDAGRVAALLHETATQPA